MASRRPSALALAALAITITLLVGGGARAQTVELGVASNDIYVGVPFVLQVSARGFEESPEPEVGDFIINGAKVSFLGMSPNVRSSTSIINGRYRSSRVVQFIYSYRVEPTRAGSFSIPPITVTQGSVSATSRPGRVQARDVANTADMRISVKVPERAVWIGENFDVEISWYLRKNPRDQTFVIPLFDHPAFEIAAPDASSSETLAFSAGGKDLSLPYQTDEVVEGGSKYTRFLFKAVVTPTKAGHFELDAPSVVAKLSSGSRRRLFARYSLFKATGNKIVFDVKPLPRSGRPPSFSNAVGSGFSIAVSSSRSVVSVGEPIELTVVVRGEHGLEGLSLPPMVGEGRLSPTLFDSAGNVPTGVMSEDGLSKTFKVIVVLNSAKATKIPPIEFSYFDPVHGAYRTTRSQPIALSVAGVEVVHADDVVSAGRKKRSKSRKGLGVAFSGDLTPSSGDRTLRTMPTMASMTPVLLGLYVFPLLMLAFMTWYRRTSDRRGQSGELRAQHKKVAMTARAARSEEASGSAGPLISSIKELARMTGNKPGPWFAELESLAFDPERRASPVPKNLVDQALAEAAKWCARGGRTIPRATATTLVLILSFLPLLSRSAHAEGDALGNARSAYTHALSIGERAARTRSFSDTEILYRKLVAQYPNRPELLADWGNAALGAGELGQAALAYKRALHLDRGLTRAKKNLNWIRQQAPSHLVAQQDAGAVDSLFFWHRSWPLVIRHLVAALSFSLAVLFLVPWQERRRSLLRKLAIIPMLLFFATLGSALLEPDSSRDAVIMRDGQALRTADSMGAPPAIGALLPAGLEVTLLEKRGKWAQVVLSDGTSGWLAGSAVATVRATSVRPPT